MSFVVTRYFSPDKRRCLMDHPENFWTVIMEEVPKTITFLSIVGVEGGERRVTPQDEKSFDFSSLAAVSLCNLDACFLKVILKKLPLNSIVSLDIVSKDHQDLGFLQSLVDFIFRCKKPLESLILRSLNKETSKLELSINHDFGNLITSQVLFASHLDLIIAFFSKKKVQTLQVNPLQTLDIETIREMIDRQQNLSSFILCETKTLISDEEVVFLAQTLKEREESLVIYFKTEFSSVNCSLSFIHSYMRASELKDDSKREKRVLSWPLRKSSQKVIKKARTC